jgi:hypothetical protein
MSLIKYIFDVLELENNTPLTSSLVNVYSPPVPIINLGLPNEFGNIIIEISDSEFIGFHPTSSNQIISYGFRIQAPGYKDVILFAEDQAGNPLKGNNIDLGKIYLSRINSDTSQAIIALQKTNASEIFKNTPSNQKAKGEALLVQSLNKKAVELKSQLIPPIVELISSFGISNLGNLILDPNILNNPEGIKELLKNIPKQCPKDLNKIIQKRNLLVKQLNSLYNIISALSTSLTGISTFLEVLKVLIPIFSALPIPNQFTTAGLIITLKEQQDKLIDFLNRLTQITGSCALVLAIIANILRMLVFLLGLLDELTKRCAEDSSISFAEINNEILSITSNQDIIELQSQQNIYKGFTLEVVLEPLSGDIQYPRRRAVARNSTGVIVLQGEPSFSSDIGVLINELKFIIDNSNYNAD